MRQAPKPKLRLLFTLMLALAYCIAPRANHEWLEAMHFELGFVSGFGEQGQFVVAALGLACKWRLASLKQLKLPQLITLTGASATALFIVLVLMPQVPPQQKLSEPSLQAPVELQAAEADSISSAEISNRVIEPSASGTASGESPDTPAIPTASALPAASPSPLSSAALGTDAGFADAESSAQADAASELAFEPVVFSLTVSPNSVLSLKALEAADALIKQDEQVVYEGRLETGAEYSFAAPATLRADFSRLELYQNGKKLDLPTAINTLELLINEP